MVENQMVAKIFLSLHFFFALHIFLLEAGTSKLVFCQKLQLQQLCCLCKHFLVLVCLMDEAPSEQDESVFQTSKDTSEK